ncbi:MAG: type II toxin-antitoxin system Phd/YefM family antitoxin [Deltaproteobacteria bacterium]|nr:type II toxin-antitoxin system Phd/YefM family antitoxin [Deltaproteobacteria bacterium]
MTRTITVTDAARNFSELLNGIRYRGERYTILKGGKPVAIIGPAMDTMKQKKLADLRGIMETLPRLGDDSEAFARDVAGAIKEQPPVGEENPWE